MYLFIREQEAEESGNWTTPASEININKPAEKSDSHLGKLLFLFIFNMLFFMGCFPNIVLKHSEIDMLNLLMMIAALKKHFSFSL